MRNDYAKLQGLPYIQGEVPYDSQSVAFAVRCMSECVAGLAGRC